MTIRSGNTQRFGSSNIALGCEFVPAFHSYTCFGCVCVCVVFVWMLRKLRKVGRKRESGSFLEKEVNGTLT